MKILCILSYRGNKLKYSDIMQVTPFFLFSTEKAYTMFFGHVFSSHKQPHVSITLGGRLLPPLYAGIFFDDCLVYVWSSSSGLACAS